MSVTRLLSNSGLLRLTGNRFVQKLLYRTVVECQTLMGIGAGTNVATSAEEAVIRRLRQDYAPPYCIFDVGANRGEFVDLVLAMGIEVNIHCFEPLRPVFDRLSGRPRPSTVTLNNVALGKSTGEALLYYDKPDTEGASLTKRNLDHLGRSFGREEMVQVDTVDNYCRTQGIAKIHLLKLDVEGHELDVLLGATDMFAKQAVEMVQFEFGGTNVDTRVFLRDFWHFFAGQKMSLLRVTPSGYLFPVAHYRELEEQFRTTNFVAIRPKSA